MSHQARGAFMPSGGLTTRRRHVVRVPLVITGNELLTAGVDFSDISVYQIQDLSVDIKTSSIVIAVCHGDEKEKQIDGLGQDCG